ncbi:MAG: hypothetical protein ABI162_02250 [Luteolibacter sp.]
MEFVLGANDSHRKPPGKQELLASVKVLPRRHEGPDDAGPIAFVPSRRFPWVAKAAKN